MSKKVVLKLDLHDDKDKQRAMKSVSKLLGIDSIAMDMQAKKLTVVGLIDPVDVVNKLRKFWHTDIVSVGPAKEPEKKKEDNKNDPKKDAGKKEGGGGGGGGGGGDGKKESSGGGGGGGDKKKEVSVHHHDPIGDMVAYRGYNPHMINPYNPHITSSTAYNPHMNAAYNNPHMANHYYVHSTAEENPNECVIC